MQGLGGEEMLKEKHRASVDHRHDMDLEEVLAVSGPRQAMTIASDKSKSDRVV